jgi:hypothetical protein
VCDIILRVINWEITSMATPILLEDLKARREALEQEKEALDRLIAIYEGSPVTTSSTPQAHRNAPTSFSVRGRVVDAIIELIHASGRQVSSKEILEHLEERGTSLGNTKNKPAMLAAMLSQETMKKSARLRKVARGVFDIKQ